VPRLVPFRPSYKPAHVADGVPGPADAAGNLALFVSEEEAAEIYARACRSWYGAKARSVVDAKIRALQAKADHKGVEAWKRVARALARQENLT
jgi:hypothetical protein